MEDGDKLFIIVVLLVVGFFGGMVTARIISNGDIYTTVPTKTLNEACENMYGNDFKFHDSRFGIETSFFCVKENENEYINISAKH